MSKKSILIIDDDEDDLDIFCEAVRDAKLELDCITAVGAVEGLAILENSILLPDYIFLDLNMPLVDGRECLKEIRKRYKDVPVIIFTTSTSIANKVELMLDGATKFVTKPSFFRHYKEVIRKAIDPSQS